MLLLGFLSLPYCYAAANGAEVLVRSERIVNEPEKRLSETAQFVFDVMAKDAFEPHGQGLSTILKIRLMHAAVRWYIEQSDNWNKKLLGVPVNQEDMAGTNLSFFIDGNQRIKTIRTLGAFTRSIRLYRLLESSRKNDGSRQELLPQDNKESFYLKKELESGNSNSLRQVLN